METVRPRRPRLAARSAAAAIAGGAGAWIAAGAGAWGWTLAPAAALAFLLACVGSGPAWAPAVLGAEYAAALEIGGHARADGRAAAVAMALVAVVELTSWSRDLEPEVPHERGVIGRRVLRIAFLVLGAGAAASVVLTLASAPLDLGLAGDAVGVAAAVAVFGLVAGLDARARRGNTSNG